MRNIAFLPQATRRLYVSSTHGKVTNIEVLTQSMQAYVSDISADKLIMLIMVVFMIVGGVDKIRGNKLGYGECFDEGFHAPVANLAKNILVFQMMKLIAGCSALLLAHITADHLLSNQLKKANEKK